MRHIGHECVNKGARCRSSCTGLNEARETGPDWRILCAARTAGRPCASASLGVSMQIIIADDHPVVLMGVRAMFNGQDRAFEIAGEAISGGASLALLSTVPCDLLITDFSMPDTAGRSE